MISILLGILVMVILLALYAICAYYAYHRVQPAERACLGCESPVTINGYDLYYRELGVERGRPPVVLVHGGPGHSSLSFKNSFDFLADETRIIYYDQRGSGNSQIKPNPDDYTIEQLVEELETLRRDVISTDKIVVIGHSFGSALAQRYALKYPEHIEKLVLIGGIRINNGMHNRFVWKWFGPALYSTALGFPPVTAQAADAWFTHSGERDNTKRIFDPGRIDLLQNTGTVSFTPWREISLSLVGYDYKTEIGQLQTPTIFIYGAADSPYTGKPTADEICSILPNCTVVGFDKSGHWPFLEEPEKFQQVLNDFLVR